MLCKQQNAALRRGLHAYTVGFSVQHLRRREIPLLPHPRKEGQPSASRDSRPTVAEARRRMKSWGSQLDVANVLERDRPFSRVGRERE